LFAEIEATLNPLDPIAEAIRGRLLSGISLGQTHQVAANGVQTVLDSHRARLEVANIIAQGIDLRVDASQVT